MKKPTTRVPAFSRRALINALEAYDAGATDPETLKLVADWYRSIFELDGERFLQFHAKRKKSGSKGGKQTKLTKIDRRKKIEQALRRFAHVKPADEAVRRAIPFLPVECQRLSPETLKRQYLQPLRKAMRTGNVKAST